MDEDAEQALGVLVVLLARAQGRAEPPLHPGEDTLGLPALAVAPSEEPAVHLLAIAGFGLARALAWTEVERDHGRSDAELFATVRMVALGVVARVGKHLVKGDALAGFGHLARRFGQLDRRRVQRLVEIGLHARHEYVREQAESAADDLETLLAWQLDRPEARR